MDKRRKTVIYSFAGAIGVIVLLLLMKFILNHQYLSQIPEIKESLALSFQVREQISDALAKAQQNPSADNLGMLGLVYHSSANYKEAAECYNLAIQRSKEAWIWNYYHGYLKLEMSESEAVIENFKLVIEKNPEIDLAWYYLGEEYRNQRKYELAEESFGHIANPGKNSSTPGGSARHDHFPLSTYARFQLSRIYIETGRMDLAEKMLREILQANRTFGPAYRLLGNIYSTMGDISLSKRYGVRANDLVVFSPPVDTLVDKLGLMSRSELYLLKKIDEAERTVYDQWTLRLVNHALEYLPDNKYLISKVISISIWMDLDEQAISFTDQHISYFQESFAELKKIGLLFFLNGLYPQSIKYLTRALELKPENIEIQKELVICYSFVGDKKKSDDILNVLFAQNQDNPDVIADIADILFFELGDGEKAKGYLARLKQISPSNPKGQKVSAGIAEKNGILQEAIALYEDSFSGDPEDITTAKNLGNLLYKQNLWDRSIRHYLEALEFHPNDPYLLERIGTLLVMCPDPEIRDSKEAIEYLERAFIHVSSRPNTLLTAGRSLAIACANLGDKRSAIKTIELTMEIGQLENISSANQAELENLYKRFQAMDN